MCFMFVIFFNSFKFFEISKETVFKFLNFRNRIISASKIKQQSLISFLFHSFTNELFKKTYNYQFMIGKYAKIMCYSRVIPIGGAFFFFLKNKNQVVNKLVYFTFHKCVACALRNQEREFLIIQDLNLKTLVNMAYFPATPHCPLTPKLTSPSRVYLSVFLSQKTRGEPLSPPQTLWRVSSYPAQNMLLVITRFC